MAAAAIALSAGFDPLSIQGGIRGFSGVPHRLETVGKLHGVRYINDSIATAPERTLAALNAFSDPMILLLGGRDKKLPWGKLADELNRKAKAAVCFGEAGPMIAQALESSPVRNPRFVVRRAATMLDALEIARELGEAGDLVLLLPGGTSYDFPSNFIQFPFDEQSNSSLDAVLTFSFSRSAFSIATIGAAPLNTKSL